MLVIYVVGDDEGVTCCNVIEVVELVASVDGSLLTHGVTRSRAKIGSNREVVVFSLLGLRMKLVLYIENQVSN